MEAIKGELLARIERDRDLLIDFFRKFIRCASPNPPGDTQLAVKHIRSFLDARGVHYRVIAPNPIMPNIVATFEAGLPGRHLALNGHIDVFPVGDGAGWSRDPWGGESIFASGESNTERSPVYGSLVLRCSPGAGAGLCADTATTF